MRLGRAGFGAVALLLGTAGVLRPQVLGADLGTLLVGSNWDIYRLSYGRALMGPLGYRIYGIHASQHGVDQNSLWGPGAELTLFQGGMSGLYLATGISGGLASGDGDQFWGSWTAALGYEFTRLGPFSVNAEGRWRSLSANGSHNGLELAAGIGVTFGPRPSRPTPPGQPGGNTSTGEIIPPLRTAITIPADASERDLLIAAVLQTATGAMGTPYKWGGTGAADGGFDCSGLIQYSYGEHGIVLPRRSIDQAKQGTRVDKRLDALQPGDVLTFSNTGGAVTHVGLYLGEGRFIHSANDGVQVSLLSADDVYGRWWYRRWVGARRIVGNT
jgi:cell wall-associated NlpC family hydrolase